MTHVLRCDVCGTLTFDRNTGCPNHPTCPNCGDPAETGGTYCEGCNVEARAEAAGEQEYEIARDRQMGAF